MRLMRDIFGNIGISIATNTALFTGLDLGQWIADTLSLWTLPANVIAAVIATAFGLALTAASRVTPCWPRLPAWLASVRCWHPQRSGHHPEGRSEFLRDFNNLDFAPFRGSTQNCVRAHDLKVVGSNPNPRNQKRCQVKGLAALPFCAYACSRHLEALWKQEGA